MYHDPSGNISLMAMVTIGGAIGNIILNAALSPSDYSTVGDALKNTVIAGTTGALGAWAGLPEFKSVVLLICGINGATNAVNSASKGSSWVYGFFTGSVGTYLGTKFDLSAYNGFDAATANGLFTMFVGGLTELAPPSAAEIHTQVMTEWINSSSYPGGHDSGILLTLANRTGGSRCIDVVPLTSSLMK